MKYIVPQPDLTVCDYESLSDEAKENAYKEWSSSSQSEYGWYREAEDTMDAFCDLFNIRITNYNIGAYQRSFINFELINDNYNYDIDFDNIKGVRLWKYLYNILSKEKTKYGNGRIIDKKYKTYTKNDKTRTSKIICERVSDITNCPLTGVCFDCWIMDAIEEYLFPGTHKNIKFDKKSDVTLYDIIDECFGLFIKYVVEDIEYSDSKEYFEECPATEKMYLENGTEYCDWCEFDKNNKEHHYQIVAE